MGEARGHCAIGIQETHRLASSGEQLLDQRDLPEAGHGLDGVTQLGGSDRELGTQARALASVPQPGFAWLDHRRESDLLQRSSDISAVAHDNLARDRHLEAPRHLERPLLVDRGRQRLFGCERQAESLLEPRSMPTQQGDGSVVGGDEHSRAGAIQPLLEEGGVGVGPFLGRKHERSLTPA